MEMPIAAAKQKSILQIGFAIVFVVSFGLIVAERIKIKQEQEKINQTEQNIRNRVVQGQITKRSPISDYQIIVKNSLLNIIANISALKQGNEYAQEKSSQTYQYLLSAQVPDLYKDMHFQLIKIAKELINPESSAMFLDQRVNEIFEQYPWLNIVIKE